MIKHVVYFSAGGNRCVKPHQALRGVYGMVPKCLSMSFQAEPDETPTHFTTEMGKMGVYKIGMKYLHFQSKL